MLNPSLRGKIENFDEAISGYFDEIAKLSTFAALLRGSGNLLGVIPWLVHGIQ
ncbi:hypothetical protein [Rickettsia tillamookensis]|uniref:hypothetical protein n=1 Tax=Rickettsia tillamookensis TaxID=2761623 RepID=UPI0019212196|nr:hypothetical protein [Rickettsia tillamookensis]